MTRKRIKQRDLRVLNSKSIYINNDFEYKWICYVRNSLHNIWSLDFNDSMGSRFKPNRNSIDIIYELIIDLEKVKFEKNYTSNEAQIWNLYRRITVAKVQKNSFDMAYICEELISAEKKSFVRLNKPVSMLIYSAKVECYIGMYQLLSHNHTTEERIGYEKLSLFSLIISSYCRLLNFAEISSCTVFTPDHQMFPNNSFLIAKAITVIEKEFLTTEDNDEQDVLEEIFDTDLDNEVASRFIKRNKSEKFTTTGEKELNLTMEKIKPIVEERSISSM